MHVIHLCCAHSPFICAVLPSICRLVIAAATEASVCFCWNASALTGDVRGPGARFRPAKAHAEGCMDIRKLLFPLSLQEHCR